MIAQGSEKMYFFFQSVKCKVYQEVNLTFLDKNILLKMPTINVELRNLLMIQEQGNRDKSYVVKTGYPI